MMQQNANNPNKAAKQYLAVFALNHREPLESVECTLIGPDQTVLRNLVGSLFNTQPNLSIAMKGKPLQFNETGPNTTNIRHESYFNGTQDLGTINEIEVPDDLSVRWRSEQRLQHSVRQAA